MKQFELKQVNPIPHRANCKILTVNNRHFIIGGLTADTITNDIIEFRIVQHQQQKGVEFKKVQIIKTLFTPRNSFSVCGSPTKIFIWGGLQLNLQQQKCLSDLIEFDVQKNTISKCQIQNQFPIHSSVLVYDQSSNQLIGYGGTNEKNQYQSFLYTLDLGSNHLKWERKRLQCKEHQGLIWQHSGHLSKTSILNKQRKGNFLIIVGGCRQPHSPYNCVVEIDLEKGQIVGSIDLDVGLVAQDSLYGKDGKLYIFGGSVGGDFNKYIYIVDDGKFEKVQGHNAIGCSCLNLNEGYVVYGGVSGIQSLNGMIIYVDEQKK